MALTIHSQSSTCKLADEVNVVIAIFGRSAQLLRLKRENHGTVQRPDKLVCITDLTRGLFDGAHSQEAGLSGNVGAPDTVKKGSPLKISGLAESRDSRDAKRLDTRKNRGCVIVPSHSSNYVGLIPEC